MGKHNKTKREEYQRKRKQVQKEKRKLSQESKMCNSYSQTEHEVQHNFNDVSRHQTHIENKMFQSDQESSFINDLSSQNNESVESPFHVSTSSSKVSKRTSFFSRRSDHKSFSWERVEATDPLLVKWEEYKMIQKRIHQIKTRTF